MAFFNYFFSFSGRITRLHWWLAGLLMAFFAVIGLTLSAIMLAVNMPPGLDLENQAEILAWLSAEAWKFAIPLLPFGVGQISLTVRRYHDRGKPGFWALLGFLPAALWFASISSPPMIFVVAPLSIIVPIWQLIELGFLAGTPGSNDFGPDPREGFHRIAAAPAHRGPPVFGRRG